MDAKSSSETLTHLLAGLRYKDFPEPLRQAALLHILDTVGVMLAGTSLDAGKRAYQLTLSLGGAPEVTLPGTHRKVSLLDGALAAAAAAHCGEMDDIHSRAGTCVGGMIIPPLLLLAEKFGADGSSFIEAVVAGYETTVRIGLTIEAPQLFSRGWWPSTVCGVFGVAAAGAKLLRWSEDRMAEALGIAGLHVGGLLTGGAEGATARHLIFGRSAQSGVVALLAAQEGFRGPRRIFEDPRGFCLTLCERPDWRYLKAPLTRFFLPEVALKPFPCARQLHAGVDALLQIFAEHHVLPDAIEKIELGVPSQVVKVVNRPFIPGNRTASLGNGQYVLAVTALRGELDLRSFEPEFLEHPEVKRLVEKIHVEAMISLDQHFPKSWPGVVNVHVKGRGVFSKTVLVPKGESENPMTSQEVEDKFLSLTSPVLGEEKALALIHELHALETARSLERVLLALRPTQQETAQ